MPQPNENSAEEHRTEAVTRLWQARGLGDDRQSAWEQARRVVQEYQDVLLDDAAESVFGRAILAEIEDIEQKNIDDVPKTLITNSLGEKWHLLRRCRQVGIDKAFEEKEGRLFDDWKWDFVEFYSLCERAGNWAVVKDLVFGQYSHLRTPQGRKFLSVAHWHQSTRLLGSLTLDELFDRIEFKGIDAAFEDLIQFGTDVPPALREDLQAAQEAIDRYNESGDRISLKEAVRKWKDVVENTDFRTASLHTQRLYLVEAGNAYEYLYREHGKDCDLSRAIELWHESSKVGAREGHADSAEFLHYLGYSHERRHRSPAASRPGTGNQGDLSDIDLAIKYYDQAYDVAHAQYGSGFLPAPMEDSPDGFAKALWRRQQRAHYRNAAGLAHLERYRTSRAVSDLKAAVLRCRQATELAEEENQRAPFLYDDLAQALEIRYAVIGSRIDALAALDAYEQALKLCHGGAPVFGLEAATHYGLLLYNLGQVPQARAALEIAHTWAQEARFEQKTRRGRLQLADLMTALYETLVTCCLRNYDEESAFQYATAAKGRSLVDSLFAEGVDLAHMVQKQSKNASGTAASDRDDYLRVCKEIEEAKTQLDLALDPARAGAANVEEPHPSRSAASLYEDLVELRHKEKNLWDDLASRYPDLGAMAKEDSPMAPADARRLSGELGCALVEYYRHRDGWCAFVVTADRAVHRPLPEVTDSLLDDLTVWVQNASQHGPGNAVLLRWYDAVLRPLRDDLPPSGTIIIAPYGPMHKLPYSAGIERDSGQYAIDEFAMGFVPSLSALDRIWQRGDSNRRLRGQPISKVLGVAYPDPPHYKRLGHATDEVAAFLRCFGEAQATELLGKQATPESVLAEARGQDVVHLCCHGEFDPQFPAQSGLILNNGWLTARSMATELDLSGSRLLTMSACSTAKASITTGDELEGLTQAALTAGTPTVVATLWEVNDAATKVLITSFYRHLVHGLAPIHAMQAAARQLREEKPGTWSHPYFWGGFVVSGLGHLPLGPPVTETRRSDGQSEAARHNHSQPAQ
ncbi:CHAT domain-containing protein [Streptomyces sp. SAI-117]|uniref:CHAT domain-containing protein n=1 Tax=Streptomyces sp. SAI-117 TaxID=2940546 RepID=UPI00247383E1|nr:CHAT domain-containing protein [Streptomyces sp. SAI-117]MDH6570436.1 CHAT domain-containing protein [Streptomyces sp. SAI-117]